MRAFVFVSLLSLTLTIPVATSAQGTQAERDARAYFDTGMVELEAGNYARAAQLFQSSYQQSPRASSICNLALTYDRWGDHREQAIAAYERCAREDPSGRFGPHALRRATELRGAQVEAGEVNPFAGESATGTSTTTTTRRTEETTTTVVRSGNPTGQIQVIETPTTAPTRVEPSRSRLLLVIGIGAVIAGAATLVGAGFLTKGINSDDAYLADRYMNGDLPIPMGSTDAQLLRDAEERRTFALAGYVAGGALMGLGAILIGVDLAQGYQNSRVALAPSRNGLTMSYRLTF